MFHVLALEIRGFELVLADDLGLQHVIDYRIFAVVVIPPAGCSAVAGTTRQILGNSFVNHLLLSIDPVLQSLVSQPVQPLMHSRDLVRTVRMKEHRSIEGRLCRAIWLWLRGRISECGDAAQITFAGIAVKGVRPLFSIPDLYQFLDLERVRASGAGG